MENNGHSPNLCFWLWQMTYMHLHAMFHDHSFIFMPLTLIFVMLLALDEGNSNDSFECIFTTCLQKGLYISHSLTILYYILLKQHKLEPFFSNKPSLTFITVKYTMPIQSNCCVSFYCHCWVVSPWLYPSLPPWLFRINHYLYRQRLLIKTVIK